MSIGDITLLLGQARDGDSQAVNRLFPLVYGELRAIAHHHLVRRGHHASLDTTGLVHEGYLKLVDPSRADWNDRKHFFRVAAMAMRQILVDYARKRYAEKRGGNAVRTPFDESEIGVERRVTEILAVDEALTRLAKLNERLALVVELRFFGGLSVEETAKVLDITDRTVKRDWRKARAFLHRELRPFGSADSPLEDEDDGDS